MPVTRKKTAKTVPVPARSKNVPVPARKTGKEAAKKAPANKKPVLPLKEESSQYSYLEDEEEELGEGSISDKEVDPDSLKTTTTKSKPAASKADAKSKATKVTPAASSSWKPGGADRGSSSENGKHGKALRSPGSSHAVLDGLRRRAAKEASAGL